MVTDYSEKDKWDSSVVSLYQYEESEYWDSLYLNESFKGDTPSISRRLADHTYVATSDTYGTCLYNLEKKSKLYNRIYQSEELTEIFGEPIIFVCEHRTATYNHKIRDNITYGINPDTYEIITPIYSELQERFIPIHTQEELEIINRNRRKNGEYEYNIHNFSPSEVTITCEIQETLDKLDDILPKAPNIYEDSLQRKINEEFVRKFKK